MSLIASLISLAPLLIQIVNIFAKLSSQDAESARRFLADVKASAREGNASVIMRQEYKALVQEHLDRQRQEQNSPQA